MYTRKHHKKKQNGLQEEINETTLKPCSRAEDNTVLVFLNTKIDLQKEKIVCKTNWNLNWVLAWLDYPASNALMERLRRGVKVFSVRGLGFSVSIEHARVMLRGSNFACLFCLFFNVLNVGIFKSKITFERFHSLKWAPKCNFVLDLSVGKICLHHILRHLRSIKEHLKSEGISR